ncbi:ABC transporter permease [Hathewaya histolytica]|uniref:Na+ ABC transporter permease n=1 Tax=Hathewaya histolytica TaxID=1498 RepID=A0A4U9QW41_HATHI|nr:ABC transporter permease [Hathewaya histolytica]VTQ82855.1 Na+ ABC transporter permease [Hathewaya histolytica]
MNITGIVFKKELKDMFRDKKTIIIGILLPLLIYPVLFGVMGKGMKSQVEEVEKGMKVALVDKGNSEFGKFLKSQKNIVIVNTNKAEEEVKDGKLLLYIDIPENIDKNILEEKKANINITYDNSSTKSNTAMSMINEYIEQYSKTIVGNRLSKRNIDNSILTPINLVKKTTEKESDGLGKLMLSIMIPMMLVMFAATGPIASATDLGAGEKERGTLEPLLTTQASRMSLLWGKFLAITVMGGITSLAFMGGLMISMQTSPEMFGGGGGISISPLALIIMGILTIALTMVFGALSLAISIYARSFKEAQTYLTPLSFVGMAGFATYAIDAKNVSMLFLNIPVLNITAILKELTLGVFNFTHIVIVLVWTLVYIVGSLLFARYMFSKESVIFRT